jgi:hypothetical protein
MPTAALAGLAECCPGGTLHKAGRPPTCKLASLPLMRQPGDGGAVPPSARGRSMRLRSLAFRSRARRDTRTPPPTRRPRRCLSLPPGQSRAGRGQATAGRGRVSTGQGPTTTRPSLMTIRRSLTTTVAGPVAVLPRRSGTWHGRPRQQQVLRPDAPFGQRQIPLHRGQ